MRDPGIDGAVVVVVGFFSARQKDHGAAMDDAARLVTELGGQVVGRFVQRRGVSDGGVQAMSRPFSSRTLLRSGKIGEIAAACEEHGVDVVVFLNALTPHQRQVLTETFARPVVSLADRP